ncbi:MAG: type VI secretion system tip protein TssI/VgrG [Minicystis sp.]
MRRARIESPALEGPEEVLRLHGEEALGGLFEYRITFAPADIGALRGHEVELLRQPLRLFFEEGDEVVSEVFGVARDVSFEITPNTQTGSIRLTLVPRLFALGQTLATRIFLDRTLPEILAETLGAAGFERDRDFVLALRGAYPAREFVVQYQESDLAFVQRLAEHAGVTLFFRHAGGRDVAVFADAPEVYEQPDGHGGVVEHHVGDDRRAAFAIAESWSRVPAGALVHDYNYRTPQLAPQASAGTARPLARGDLIEYGAHAKAPEEAAALARVRAEEAAAGHHVVRGKTRDLALRGGARFTLRHAAGHEQPLLLTRVVTRSHPDGAPETPEARDWHNEITAIPAHVPYRPPRVTPRPRAQGLVHAVVDGALRGPYAEIDEHGRYKVRFRYDLAGRPDLQATHRVRMMQPHAGARYGMHFPLRPGTEVLIGFVEGDPDRPIIVGTAPNPITPSPVEQPNLTQNVLRTGSGNEMVLDDFVEQERIRIHTPKEDTTLQLGHVDEPELGALLVTDANITEAAGRSINELTDRKALLSRTEAGVVGDTSVTLAGVPALESAADDGAERLPSTGDRVDAAIADLARLAEPPGAFLRGADDEQPAKESVTKPYTGLFSDVAGTLADAARDAGLSALRAIAEAADTNAADSIGRRQGEPAGQPDAPAIVHGSLETAGVFGRSRALFYGERVASLSSYHTASVVGGRFAELQSPGTVEIAGAKEALVTSAGTVDVAARLVRVVAGYYPQKEAPELDDGTSLGVMARRDLRLNSIEDCILVCAHKNFVAAAHTGEMRLKAQKTVSVKGASVVVSGGYVGLDAGDLRATARGDVTVTAGGDMAASAGGSVSIEAGGAVSIKGATVTIEGGTITLNGPVTVCGDLTVTGALHGG